MSDDILRKNITTLRKERNWSQRQLAKYLKIDNTSLNRIEKGSRKVTSDELEALSNIFKVSTDFLLGRFQMEKHVLKPMLNIRIRELRNNKNQTQKDFAKTLRVSQQTVAAWESGRVTPSADTLNKLADYFDVSADYLLGRSSTRKPESHDLEDVMSFDGQPLNENDRKLLKEIAWSIQKYKE